MSKHSILYSGKFKDVKNHLPKLMLNRSNIRELKSVLGFLTGIKIGYATESSLNPDVMLEGTKGKAVITHFFKINQLNDNEWLHVGYRRSDDWLALDGKLIHKSNRFKFTVELMLNGGNWLKYGWYLVNRLFASKSKS